MGEVNWWGGQGPQTPESEVPKADLWVAGEPEKVADPEEDAAPDDHGGLWANLGTEQVTPNEEKKTGPAAETPEEPLEVHDPASVYMRERPEDTK